MYGSQREPKLIFGDNTPELSAFYVAAEKTAPGAWQLLQELLGAWQPYALAHEWTLPDGFLSRIRVKESMSCRPSIDELGGASFTYVYKEYRGIESGISLPANVTHSVDAYVVRCIQRRCNYDVNTVNGAYRSIVKAINGIENYAYEDLNVRTQYYIDLYNRTGMADVVILPYLTDAQAWYLSNDHLQALKSIIEMMLQHKPFPVVTVHDEFKCHPNNMNHLRLHYREIFAQIAESTMLNSIMSEITGTKYVYKKLAKNLGAAIRESNYAIC